MNQQNDRSKFKIQPSVMLNKTFDYYLQKIDERIESLKQFQDFSSSYTLCKIDFNDFKHEIQNSLTYQNRSFAGFEDLNKTFQENTKQKQNVKVKMPSNFQKNWGGLVENFGQKKVQKTIHFQKNISYLPKEIRNKVKQQRYINKIKMHELKKMQDSYEKSQNLNLNTNNQIQEERQNKIFQKIRKKLQDSNKNLTKHQKDIKFKEMAKKLNNKIQL